MAISQTRKEMWVGVLVVATGAFMLTFGWLMGLFSVFASDAQFRVRYAFGGGVEVGSPVRVSGVKVGRVDSIRFLPDASSSESIELVVQVAKAAMPAIREDSRFFVNMAGIIGERYLEISPGKGKPLANGSVVRGEDPPRVDQLLSQGYGVFGKIQEFIDDNQETLTEFIAQLRLLIRDTNQFLSTGENRQKFFSLIDNLNGLTGDLRSVSGALRGPDARERLRKFGELVDRLHDADSKTIRRFLQDEGVRVRIF